jgi:hypothetical protein
VSKKTSDDYEIGYGKPPKSTQFQKGTSGNRTGRPKKRRDLATTILNEAHSLMSITENGRQIRVSQLEVIMKQLSIGAMKGKTSDQKLYLALYSKAVEEMTLREGQVTIEDNRKDPNTLTMEQLMRIAASGPEYKQILEEEEEARRASEEALVEDE